MSISTLPSAISLYRLLAVWQTAVSHTRHTPPPPYTGPDIPLTRLTEDTRQVIPGAAFVARVRLTGDGRIWSDGHPYIPQAISQGASLIIAQHPAADLGLHLPTGVIYWQVPDTAETLAWLAAAWEGFPSQHLVIIGVTGTDGKSSTAQIIHTLLQTAGYKAGMLSTIKAIIGGTEEPLALHVTTPEAPVVQRYLRRMVDAGLTHCVLETTSHALAQHRVTAVAYDLAVVTNITHEHLDFHGSRAAYQAAKARLFQQVAAGGFSLPTTNPYKQAVVKTAVLNRDDDSYPHLAAIAGPRQLTYALHHPATLTATDIRYDPQATNFGLTEQKATPDHPSAPLITLSSPLVGEFNVYNMLAAATVALALGITPDLLKQGLEAVPAISGRMERIDQGQPFQVIVDFAHTPISLEKAIGVVRQMVQQQGRNGRILTVFGSAGKRDVTKRHLMAAISARDADLTILTAEDPRTESLDDILALMAAGCREAGGREGQTFWRIPDRGQAIYFALTLARPADVLLICGKGHEQSICFGTTEYPWDDRDVTRAALHAFRAGQPMVDWGLPTFQT